MIMRIYTIYDSVSMNHGPLMLSDNDNVMIRNLKELLASGDNRNEIVVHSNDLTLKCIGTYNTHSGVINSIDPESVVFIGQLKTEVIAELKKQERSVNGYSEKSKS